MKIRDALTPKWVPEVYVALEPQVGTKTSGVTAGQEVLADASVPWTPKPFTWAQQVGIPTDSEALAAAPGRGATKLSWSVGAPSRPDITHDNGGLQDPNDDTSPVPIPKEAPTLADYEALAKWSAMLKGAELLRPDLADACAAYRHYLEGAGRVRKFDLNRLLENDPTGAEVLGVMIQDAQRAAFATYERMIALQPELASKTVTFSITSSAARVGDDAFPDFPQPETENWLKTVGGYSVWASATITIAPTPDGPRATMQLTLHAEDRYNFDPGKQDIHTGIQDAENARLEKVGLTTQFVHVGEATRDVEWKLGPLGLDAGRTIHRGRRRTRSP